MTEQRARKSRSREQRRIPDFASREEEAAFWDTHDFSDYWDELTPVKVRAAKNLSEGITIRLDPDTLDQLRARAHDQGIGPTTLVRMWILERLKATSG
jgi:predicted DNA binding CopG/RHH family protein